MLPSFRKPLSLLLRLVGRLGISVFSVPVARIAFRCLHCLSAVRRVGLSVTNSCLLVTTALLRVGDHVLLPGGRIAFRRRFCRRNRSPERDLVRRLIRCGRFRRTTGTLGAVRRRHNLCFAGPTASLRRLRRTVPLTPNRISTTSLVTTLRGVCRGLRGGGPLRTEVRRRRCAISRAVA